MLAFKQFSMTLFALLFVAGLLFDILNRELPEYWLESSTLSVDEAERIIVNTFSSTFAIDQELAAQ